MGPRRQPADRTRRPRPQAPDGARARRTVPASVRTWSTSQRNISWRNTQARARFAVLSSRWTIGQGTTRAIMSTWTGYAAAIHRAVNLVLARGLHLHDAHASDRGRVRSRRRGRARPHSCALLPDARLAARRRRCLSGDLPQSLAWILQVRGTKLRAHLAVPDRDQRVPRFDRASAEASPANRLRTADPRWNRGSDLAGL